MKPIRIAIVGVGNCASSPIQGINHYRKSDSSDAIGLLHREIGGYRPWEIEVAAAFDLFKRRGVKLERTYQISTGGNTDFLNMLNRRRSFMGGTGRQRKAPVHPIP